MLHCHHHVHHHHLLFPNLPVPLSLTHHQSPLFHSSVSPSPPLHFLHRPSIPHTTVSAIPSALPPWLIQLTSATEELGLIQFPLPTPSLFTNTDDPSNTIQVTSTVLLTGAFTLFLFRSIRRRAKKAKELRFRSSGATKSLDTLKAMGVTSIKAKKKPSPDQALIGAIIAGVIAVMLYRFTTAVEATLFRQTVSDNFSVRQITVTIRTIINGLCYLATFVYGINSVGLFLYSGQLAMNTFVGDSSGKETKSKIIEQAGLSNSSSVENLTSSNKLSSTKEDQSSNNS